MVRDLSLTTSTTILDELDEVLARPKFRIPGDERSEIRRVLLLASDDVAIFDESEAPRHVPGDPGDDHVVEAALRTSAEVVVTMDPDLGGLKGVPFEILGDGLACERYRSGVPYGETVLLSPDEQRAQRRRLFRSRGSEGNLRRAAYVPFREMTRGISVDEIVPGAVGGFLSPVEASELATDIVRTCGQGLVLDIRDGGSFDYLSGVRFDAPGASASPALDLIWYSSGRAQAEAITQPEAPTISDFGWPDEHRHRVVLAGGVLIIAGVRGPDGEDDVRFLALVGEPLSATPRIKNDYRLTYTGRNGTTLHVVAMDPAGFTSSSSVWLPGGPCAVLSPTPLPRDALDVAFLTADQAAQKFGMPIPPPELLEAELPEEFQTLIVRPRG